MGKQREDSEALGNQIVNFRKESIQIRDDQIQHQTEITEEFRKRFTVFWEYAQQEMNDNKNEEFALNREITKLTNEIKSIQNSIEQADVKLKGFEKELGMKISHSS